MNKQQTGFTLLEVLVAFSIAAVALIALMNIFSNGIRLSTAAEDYSRASILAESLAAQIGAEYGLHNTPASGTFADHFKWKVEISPYIVENVLLVGKQPAKLVHWVINIDWQEGVKKRNFHLSSLRLAPNQSR